MERQNCSGTGSKRSGLEVQREGVVFVAFRPVATSKVSVKESDENYQLGFTRI
jgi:hypothetical protein